MEEKIKLFHKALENLCVRARVKTVDQLIGKTVHLLMMYKEHNYYYEGWESILRIDIMIIDGEPQEDTLFIKLNRGATNSGRDNTVIEYDIHSSQWKYCFLKKDDSIEKSYDVEMTFPRKKRFFINFLKSLSELF